MLLLNKKPVPWPNAQLIALWEISLHGQPAQYHVEKEPKHEPELLSLLPTKLEKLAQLPKNKTFVNSNHALLTVL